VGILLLVSLVENIVFLNTVFSTSVINSFVSEDTIFAYIYVFKSVDHEYVSLIFTHNSSLSITQLSGIT
jgi:hypothetical protein